MVGSSAQSSITRSGQPWRALAASAIRGRFARSCRPQISVVGTAIRAETPGGMRGTRTRASGGRAAFALGARARSRLYGDERVPALAHLLAQAVQVERALPHEAL